MLSRVVTPSLRRSARAFSATPEAFPFVQKVQYEGPKSTNPLGFKDYNADEMIMGKPMKDWCRFAVVYWHTFRGGGMDPFSYGCPTLIRPWDDGTNSIENANRRVDVAFEFFTKLGVEYYAWHDIDIAPEGATMAESFDNLEKVTDYALTKQHETGVKLLWGTSNLFSNKRYMNGGGTNPDFHAFACGAATVKKAMDCTLKLGGENYVFWGGREGYNSILNTDIKMELDNFAAFLTMARDYRNSIGADFQLLIEPKPREPTKHQYDYDAQTVMGFLEHYGLEKDFKLNIEPNHTTLAGHDYEHDIIVSSKFDMLGSVDCNTGDPLVGWDTDQFLMDERKATLVMKCIVEQGGLAPGGLNFDCKVRRESTDLEDMFISHIASMDCFAKGLRNAARLIEQGTLDSMVADRYATWNSGLAADVKAGKGSLDACYDFVMANGEPKHISAQQELYERVFNHGCDDRVD